jgi:hypothetical protein
MTEDHLKKAHDTYSSIVRYKQYLQSIEITEVDTWQGGRGFNGGNLPTTENEKVFKPAMREIREITKSLIQAKIQRRIEELEKEFSAL